MVKNTKAAEVKFSGGGLAESVGITKVAVL